MSLSLRTLAAMIWLFAVQIGHTQEYSRSEKIKDGEKLFFEPGIEVLFLGNTAAEQSPDIISNPSESVEGGPKLNPGELALARRAEGICRYYRYDKADTVTTKRINKSAQDLAETDGDVVTIERYKRIYQDGSYIYPSYVSDIECQYNR